MRILRRIIIRIINKGNDNKNIIIININDNTYRMIIMRIINKGE